MWLLLGLGGLRRKRASAELQYRVRTVHELEADRGPVARAVRCARNAGCGASSTVGKREGFSF
jgi:hypothetical protein